MRTLDLVHDVRPTLARHPHPLALNATVQLAAASVLLQERVEGNDQLGHGARSVYSIT